MLLLFPKQKNLIEFVHSSISMLMCRHSIDKFTLILLSTYVCTLYTNLCSSYLPTYQDFDRWKLGVECIVGHLKGTYIGIPIKFS